MAKKLFISSTECVTGGSNAATFTIYRVSALMLLLATELLVIALCTGLAGKELGPIDTSDGPIADELYDAARPGAAA